MNVAFFLKPKANVAYLYDDFTLRQGLEKMRTHGYTAIPVLSHDNEYVGTVSEGDFLWYLVGGKLKAEPDQIVLPKGEKMRVGSIVQRGKTPPVLITATLETLLMYAENQNFVPVVDDRNKFIGIVTRSDIITHFAKSSFIWNTESAWKTSAVPAYNEAKA